MNHLGFQTIHTLLLMWTFFLLTGIRTWKRTKNKNRKGKQKNNYCNNVIWSLRLVIIPDSKQKTRINASVVSPNFDGDSVMVTTCMLTVVVVIIFASVYTSALYIFYAVRTTMSKREPFFYQNVIIVWQKKRA